MASVSQGYRQRGPFKHTVSRRGFLRAAGILGGSVALGATVGRKTARANEDFPGYPDRFGMLTDTSLCIGCRMCEVACAKMNNLPAPDFPPVGSTVFDKKRRTSERTLTVVNRYSNPSTGQAVFRKEQCMHCNEPACVSACFVAALKKMPEGMVVYNEDVCVGCRFCMIACPFNQLVYSYSDPFTPAVMKCQMCKELVVKEGKMPACAEACPPKAIRFGRRRELLKIAHDRISKSPGRYMPTVYGEEEVGGTGWLYLSTVPFEKLGLPTELGKTPYPELTRDFLLGVPMMYLMWPPILAGLAALMKRRDQVAEEEKRGHHDEEVKS